MYKAVIYKDSFNGVRLPWRADLYQQNCFGQWELFINGWITGHSSRSRLTREIHAVNSKCKIERRTPRLDQ